MDDYDDLFRDQPDYCENLDTFCLSAADVMRMWCEGGYNTRKSINILLENQHSDLKTWAAEWSSYEDAEARDELYSQTQLNDPLTNYKERI